MNVDRDIIELSSKLRFISKIGPNEKVDVSGNYISPDNYRTKFIRTIFHRSEDRWKTLTFIDHTFDDAVAVLNSDHKYRHIILENLKNIKPGLLNLKDTYSTDTFFESRIETLIDILDKKLEEYDT